MKKIVATLYTISFLFTLGSSDCDGNAYPGLNFHLNGNNLKWPCESTKNIYTQTGRYIPKNVIITRAQIDENIAYVTTPRYRQGVPFTLGQIDLEKNQCLPHIEPFPCWSIQEEGNCEALQSVVDIVLDHNKILWALDLGIVNTLTQPIRRCPPKIVAFNTITGNIVKMIDLSKFTLPQSRLQFLVVDYNRLGKPFIYISDASTYSILVYDVESDKKYRIVLPPATHTHDTDDVLYINLAKELDGNNSTLYFTYLRSQKLYSIDTEFLKQGKGGGAINDIGPKPNGLPIVLLGNNGADKLYFRYKGQNDIFEYDTKKCFVPVNFIEVQSCGECRLATQVMPGSHNYMWTLESNFYDYINGTTGCNGASIVLHPIIKNCDGRR